MQIVHGDYLLFRDFNLLVIGYNHEDEIRCLPHYYHGKKIHAEERNPLLHPELKEWTKFDTRFMDAYTFLKKEEIEKIFIPEQVMKELLSKTMLSPMEEVAVDFANIMMDDVGIREEEMGICGSLLLGKEKANDVDFSIYGKEPCLKAISYVLESERFEFPASYINNQKFFDPQIPPVGERYASYVFFRGYVVDIMYNFERGHLENEEITYLGMLETELAITDSSLGPMRPSIYQACMDDGKEIEVMCYPLRGRHFHEGDRIIFKGKRFSRNGKIVGGIFNPSTEKMKILYPDVAQCSEDQ